MKNWIRWIVVHSFVGSLVTSCLCQTATAQNGYNTSPGRPGVGAPGAGAPGAGSPGTGAVPGGANRGGPANPAAGAGNNGTGAANNGAINPALNPALRNGLGPQVPTGGSPGQTVVTKDPYQQNPITPAEQQYLDQLLNYWEQSTRDVERLSCEFKLFEYNSEANFVRELAKASGQDIRMVKSAASSGVLRYMKPDKGMYRIDKVIGLTGKLDANKQPEMTESENVVGDYWICDGETVHSYDRKQKVVTHYQIPPNMRGLGILESPMPFLFGVEAKKIKERYWIRALAPPPKADGQPNQDIFLIEAYPKFQQDAVNYLKVHVFLDRKEFLPLALIKYNPEHTDEPGQPLVDSRSYYEFVTRDKNASVLTKLNEGIFRREFIPVKLPAGWTEETKEYVPAGSESLQASIDRNPGAPLGNGQPQPNNGAFGPLGQSNGAPGVPVKTPPQNPTGPNSASRPGTDGTRK